MRYPTIVVSTGDPAGIGPEIIVKALADHTIRGLARWIVVGEAWMYPSASASTAWFCDRELEGAPFPDNPGVYVQSCQAVRPDEVTMGELNVRCGAASLAYIEAATKLCLDGIADAIVTAPVNKQAVSLTGTPFTGHTEYLAELCGCKETRMLLVNDKLRVVHVTTHCALADAVGADQARVWRTLELGHAAMLAMGVPEPRIAVCGLNPHAGEEGLFGDQERRVIAPAIQQAAKAGIDVSGPFPADTLFLQAVRGQFDLVVAMYHDQGHIPMKLLDFEHTVNISLGLPILRTSVDHGTAFDIAGMDRAEPSDMKTAMRFAVQMASQPQRAGTSVRPTS